MSSSFRLFDRPLKPDQQVSDFAIPVESNAHHCLDAFAKAAHKIGTLIEVNRSVSARTEASNLTDSAPTETGTLGLQRQ